MWMWRTGQRIVIFSARPGLLTVTVGTGQGRVISPEGGSNATRRMPAAVNLREEEERD